MSDKMTMEYQEVKFGEIARQIAKRVDPSETNLDIYVGLEHLDPDSLKIARHGVPSDVKGEKLLVKQGQIIFGKRRAYQRKLAVADWDCICSAHAMVLEAIPGKILPEFLPFFMQSNQFMERAVEISEGSLSPTIKWKVLSEQIFKIPNFSSQKNAISTLKKILAMNTIISNQIGLADILYRLKSNKIFSEIDDKHYKILKDIGTTYTGLQSKTAVDFANGNKTYIPYLNIFNNRIIDSDFLEKVKIDKDEKQNTVNKGDIFFTVSSEIADEVGMSSVLNAHLEETYLNSFCVGFRPKPDQINNQYISHYLRSEFFRRNLKKLAQGSTRFNIARTQLIKEKIKLPKIDDQLKIANELEKYSNLQSKLNFKKENLNHIYFKLLNEIIE